MRHHTRPAGPLLLAAVLMAGCGTGPEQPPGAAPEPAAPVETTIAPVASPETTTSLIEAPAAGATTTTAPAPAADVEGGVSDPDSAEVEQLLAEIEESLAGLDQLMNDAAAGMAAEEGEIIP